jgi:DNA polymerase-1
MRQIGERQAMNSGIQGLAADIFKVAIVRLDHGLEAGGFESRLVLQVHDEVIVEAVVDEHQRVEALVRDSMCNAADLAVPLEVNLAWGDSWASAKA